MKHSLPLVALLSLSLSLSSWTGAQGQTAITLDPPMISPAQLDASPIGKMSQLLVRGRARRAHRFAHPAFQIRLGRSFSITVPKN